VDELAIRGGPEGDGGLIVVRVPVLAFFDALERIGELGVVLDQNVQTQDVTEEFVDLEAQERNVRAQEVRVLDLLKDARGLNEILLLENELSRLRGLVEQVQGRLNFLERRTQLSTIRVTMRRPVMIESVTRVSQPPSASLTVAVDDVDGARVSLEAVVEQAGGVVERSTVRVSGAEESATLRLLLPRADFDDVIRAAEGLGEVRDKTVEKGEERVPAAPGVVFTEPDGPDAPFGLLLVSNVEPAPIETNDGDQTWLAILLGTLLGLVVLAAAGAIHWLIRRRPPASA